MRTLRRALPVLLLTSLSTISLVAQAHDSYGATAVTSTGVSQQKQYNPWRPAPRQWGSQWGGSQHKQQRAPTVPQHAHTPSYAVTPHPIHVRQYEYRNYVQQVNPYYGNGGIPWWSDPVAVPYGPWAIGNGWPNGLW